MAFPPRLHALVVACLAAALLVARPAAAQATGSYLALRIDQSPLPLADRVTDTDGTTYLIEFDRMVLSLR